MEDRGPSSDTIIFLGTAGARIMVANQILASGGLWLNLSGTEILLDPGPGSIGGKNHLQMPLREMHRVLGVVNRLVS